MLLAALFGTFSFQVSMEDSCGCSRRESMVTFVDFVDIVLVGEILFECPLPHMDDCWSIADVIFLGYLVLIGVEYELFEESVVAHSTGCILKSSKD